MIVRRPSDVLPSEITPESAFLNRRKLMQAAAVAGLAAAIPGWVEAETPPTSALANVKPGPFSTTEKRNTWDEATSYNNYYEFGTDKGDPADNAAALKIKPWTVTVEGEVAKPGVIPLETFLQPYALEERVYRLRCVEAWSMVIPWIGIPLAQVLKPLQPTSRAKYVAFETIYRPAEMVGQQRAILEWPYREGLRIDEAMHPLTILAVGMYGRQLANQNGAPLRLIVPWKYGFKSIKSIVKIRLQETQPVTTWNTMSAREYGFYSNVNPEVDHPRWSQKTERRIGELFRRPTAMFNGYADQVSSLYTGLDLKTNF